MKHTKRQFLPASGLIFILVVSLLFTSGCGPNLVMPVPASNATPGNNEPGIQVETMPAAEKNANRFNPLPGVVVDVPDVVGQENQSDQYSKGDRKIKHFQGKDLPLNHVGTFKH